MKGRRDQPPFFLENAQQSIARLRFRHVELPEHHADIFADGLAHDLAARQQAACDIPGDAKRNL